MDITITPTLLKGDVTPPSSKSFAHRALLASFLSKGESILHGITPSEDMEATCRCGNSLGAEYKIIDETYYLSNKNNNYNKIFDCGESGSTLRFIIPIASVVCGKGIFTGRGRLLNRPLEPFVKLFKDNNIIFNHTEKEIKLDGKLSGGNYFISGDISSQFLTGLLFALPLAKNNSTITLTTPLQSKGYIDITLDVLKSYGINIIVKDNQYIIKANQEYKAQEMTIEKDYSQAAFFYVANALGNNINILNMNEKSVQGDKEIINHIHTILNFDNPIINIEQEPDLMPILTVLASLQKNKTTKIIGTKRLRIKESDRIKTTTQALINLGANIIIENDDVIINGKEFLEGGIIDCANDHRIAMSMAIAATKCKNNVTLLGAECVKKSYVNFWKDYNNLVKG